MQYYDRASLFTGGLDPYVLLPNLLHHMVPRMPVAVMKDN